MEIGRGGCHMERLNASRLDDHPFTSKLTELILSGVIFCYPTDTCYALGANALNEESVYRVFVIKDRDISKPLPVIVRDLDVAAKFSVIGPKARAVLEAFPGISVVVPKRHIPDIVNPTQIMLRIPDSHATKKLLSNIRVPIVSTSANRAGDENPYSVNDISSSLSSKLSLIDFALDAGKLDPKPPSTILDCIEGKVYREGVYSEDEVMEVFNAAD
ncbi:MAG TPA: threonylcarbamoyl-AMP synthase [Methanomicrobia archaeon]|nr:threonylcarbamoyl-AMP synthase [Methanomicrobia archaeon]